MRLINCQTLELEEFNDAGDVEYAILSHRWEGKEITYQEILADKALVSRRKSYQKIKDVCEKAIERGLTHVWVDTCCINKDSSAELSEAINSMYRWYALSAICYVYLFDFDVRPCDVKDESQVYALQNALAKSSWFYRAWTLQELIAPKHVVFYDCGWRLIDDKIHLAALLSNITKIPNRVLCHDEDPHSLSIWERMTWAGDRQSSRIEDIAYSLLGLFEVNMPMLYGEGTKAFRRLQEQILKETDDQTIFLWQMTKDSTSAVLASHPSDFSGSSIYVSRPLNPADGPFALTNIGLSIRLEMLPWVPGIYLALLKCYMLDKTKPFNFRCPGIFLKKMEGNHFERVLLHGQSIGIAPDPFTNSPMCEKTMNIYIKLLQYRHHPVYHDFYGFRVRISRGDCPGFCQGSTEKCRPDQRDLCRRDFVDVESVQSRGSWDRSSRTVEMPPGIAGTVAIITTTGPIKAIMLGFGFDFQPRCVLSALPVVDDLPESLSDFCALTAPYEAVFDVRQKPLLAVNCMEVQGWTSTGSAKHDPAQNFYLQGEGECRLNTYHERPGGILSIFGRTEFRSFEVKIRRIQGYVEGNLRDVWNFDLIYPV